MKIFCNILQLDAQFYNLFGLGPHPFGSILIKTVPIPPKIKRLKFVHLVRRCERIQLEQLKLQTYIRNNAYVNELKTQGTIDDV